MSERDLGPLGEAEFRRLCHSVSLTVHKSEMDRTGWDFFVEFPFNRDDSIPKDMLAAPLKCTIQVKATDKQRKVEQIYLSNLRWLVTTPMPAFFCFIEFDGKDSPQAVYLVHVEKEIMEKTLKRIRELENKGGGDRLNKHKLNISYNNSNRLSNITGSNLKSEIEKYVPDGLAKYTEDKNRLLKTLGFEDGCYQLNFTIVGTDPIGDLLDLTLGIRKELEIYHSSGYHKRFGILSKEPHIDCNGGIVSIQAKPIEVKLKFKEYKFSPGISFDAKLYVPSLNRFIPEKQMKLRITSSFFEFIIRTDQINFSVHLYSERVVLGELKNFIEILTILENPSNSVTVELESEIINSLPFLNFSSNDLSPSLRDISFIDHQLFNWSDINGTAQIIIDICRKMHISESDVLANVEDLIDVAKRPHVQLLYQALYGKTDASRLFLSELPNEREYEQGARAAVVCFLVVHVGNHIIGCCVGIIGLLALLDKQYMLTIEKFLTGQQFAVAESKTISKEIVDEGFNELIEELKDENLAIIVVQ